MMLFGFGLLVCLVASGESAKQSHRLPPSFPQCHRSDPQLSACLLDATEKVRDQIAKGVPELRIPKFEPFVLPEVVLQQGTQSLNFKAILKNIVIHGLSKYKFTRFDFDVPNLQFFCDANIPSLKLEGDYDVNGRILIAPIVGKGRFTANVDSCDIKMYQKCREGEINGENHIIPYFTNSTIEVSGPMAHLDGLFNGNKELNDVTNKAINDNVNELFGELKPVLEETITRIMEDLLLKHIAKNIPYDYLYPK
ncbi:hypothetical protein GWI33_002605 [Rhynchophorus ferrugineus]|uniref:Uncharacterized protein n=1 Tax=Rhynchophorus ferrugineus TaxID=354439 RepID=A0A834IPC0_RHYFE|nr:hypothetical protein GWI33_002605 [Rhynchophorus ferrugineus]